MANVRVRTRRIDVLKRANAADNQRLTEEQRSVAKKRYRRPAKYGSEAHKQRIREGVLMHFYGRPLKAFYQKPKYVPRRTTPFRVKTNSTNYFHRRKGRRPTQMR